MNYAIDFEVDVHFDFDYEEVYHMAVDGVLDFADCPYETSVNLLITDNEGIRAINAECRGIDAPTDVLSFPMTDYTSEGNFDGLEDDIDAFDPDSGELLLGDIVLSIDRIISQAEEYGHSVKREYAFLIVHSMLHLIGYDHMEEDMRIRMEDAQKRVMEAIKITR